MKFPFIKIIVALCLFMALRFSAQPLHEYFFNNSLAGTNGGPTLTQNLACGAAAGTFGTQTISIVGGTCNVSNVFCFNQGGGLSYANPSYITNQYSINLFFEFNTLGGWSRIIDFSNSTADAGIYLLNNCLNFYPNGTVGSCPFFNATTYYLFTFVRDGTTNIISVYVNGSLFGTYNDAGNLYRPAVNTTPINFFRDDNVVPCEAKAGCVRYASITSATMTASQVATTYSNICNVILPVELSSFTANEEKGYVKLNWSTQSEKNTKSFEIEKSGDGIEFTKIGEVKSRNQPGPSDYSFNDYQVLKGISYYRLKQNDLDGNYKYSPIAATNFMSYTPLFHPNPAFDRIWLNSASGLVIRNCLGETVLKENAADKKEIDISQLAPGTYYVSSGEKVQKLIISR